MMNRSMVDIAATILDVARDGATKTRIMYGSLISVSQFEEYLKLLSDTQLITQSQDGQYFTAPKGLHFLKVYKSVGHMMVSPDDVYVSDSASRVQEILDDVAGRF